MKSYFHWGLLLLTHFSLGIYPLMVSAEGVTPTDSPGGATQISGPKATAGETVPGEGTAAGGRKAYIDPRTGRLTTPSAEDSAVLESQLEALQPSLSTSHEGLEVTELPDGSIMVDLRGRFQKAIFATINEEGDIVLSHDPKLLDSQVKTSPQLKQAATERGVDNETD